MSLNNVSERLEQSETILSGYSKMIQNIQSRTKTPKMPVGIGSLDEIVRGLHPGELTVIAARPSHGKTTMACQIGWSLAWKTGVKVGVFSLEMGRLSLLERIFCFDQHVNGSLLRAGRASEVPDEKWNLFRDKLAASHFEIFDNVGDSTKELNEFFEFHKIEKRPKGVENVCLIFDHAQMCSQRDFRGKYEALSDYVRTLKILAVKYEIAVVVTSQLNRHGIGSTGSEYLKGSGEIEEAADVVWLCRYPARLDSEHWLQSEKEHFVRHPDDRNYYTVQVDKNRNGETGFVELFYEPSSFFFRERRVGE